MSAPEPSTLVTLFGIILFVAFSVLFTYIAWRSAQEWGRSALLKTYGRWTQGKVSSYGSNGARLYFITYRFNAQKLPHRQVSYEKEQQVSRRHAERIHKEEQVEVVFLPWKPAISKLSGEHSDNTRRDIYTIFALLGILLFPLSPVLIIVWTGTFLIERDGYRRIKQQ